VPGGAAAPDLSGCGAMLLVDLHAPGPLRSLRWEAAGVEAKAGGPEGPGVEHWGGGACGGCRGAVRAGGGGMPSGPMLAPLRAVSEPGAGLSPGSACMHGASGLSMNLDATWVR
jgi:hypothetical protein